MKHEYTDSELAELKNIYDEQGEAGLSITEMRALRKAGLLTQGLPAKPEEPSKRDLILAHCQKRIDQGQPFDGKETAETLGMSPKTAGNKEEPMSQGTTANGETAPEKQCENPRAIITNALVGIYDSISALQRAAYHANDKVVYMFATKLLDGELMDIKANYSKDAK